MASLEEVNAQLHLATLQELQVQDGLVGVDDDANDAIVTMDRIDGMLGQYFGGVHDEIDQLVGQAMGKAESINDKANGVANSAATVNRIVHGALQGSSRVDGRELKKQTAAQAEQVRQIGGWSALAYQTLGGMAIIGMQDKIVEVKSQFGQCKAYVLKEQERVDRILVLLDQLIF